MLQPGGQTIKKAIAVPMEEPEVTIFEDEADFGGDVSEEEGEKVKEEDETNFTKDKYIKSKDLSSAKGKASSSAKAGVKRKATASASSSSKKKK
jgi:F0F1-type ATP synthase epsilon subunit